MDRNLEADLWLSKLSQMSMVVIFVPCINKSLVGKRLASICSVLVDDAPNGVSGNFYSPFSRFHEGDGIVWKTETEDLLKGLDGFAQKLDVVAAVIFTFIYVKGESESKQQQPCYFCYDHILDNGWTFCGGIISFLNTIVECYHMECYLSPMSPVCYLLPTTKIHFWASLSICFEVIYENPLQIPEYLQPHISYILSNTNSSSTQLKVLSNWSKITTFVFP